MQQKLPSTLSHQDRCFSSIARFFINLSSYAPFDAFRDDSLLQMMNAVAWENDFKSLNITHLKTCLAAKYNEFEKAARQAALDHYEESNKNIFC